MTWLREEWLAARNADDAAAHPRDCRDRCCARDEAYAAREGER